MDKRSGRRAALRGKQIALAVATAFLPWGEAYPLPTGEQVVAGQVTVSRPDPQRMQIDQASQKGIVNWQGFSIGASEHVNITQPSSSAALLNRVVGNDPSHIFGQLTANGQVFLVNNAGVLFAPGASVAVGSLVASTLSITDQNFLNGNYQFYNAGNAGSVVNQGSIVTANGYTALVGPQVRNDGVIVAQRGSVALAAGDRVLLDLIGDGLISISVDQAALDASVINTGEINAEGGSVLLTARSANALLDTVINTSGVIRAVSLVERNGEIVLDGGSRGTVSAGGRVYGGGKVSVLAGDGLVLNAEVNAPALDVAAAGDIAIGAYVFSSGPISIRTSEPGSDVVFTGNNFFSFGPLSIEAGGDVSFVADGTRNALVTSRGGQTINARSLAVTARGGGIASVINDLGGDQIITLTGGNLDVQMNGGGFAQLGNFGPGSQTIAVDGGRGAITVASRGVDANSFSGSAVLSSASAQTINAGSLTIIAQAGGAAGVNAAEQTITLNGGSLDLRTVDGGYHAGLTTFGPGNQSISVHGGGNINVSAGNGGNAVISAENGNQTLAISGGGSFDAYTLAGGGSVQVMTFAGNQTITVRDGDHIAINAADGGSVSARTQAGTQTLSITGASRNSIVIVAGVGGNASLTSAGGQNINAKSVEITSRDGGFASIGNNNTGDQTITVSGGGIDVQSVSGGGFAFITNSGLGRQTITVSDGSGVDVRSVSGGGSGQINNFGLGNQTITVSGGGGVEVQTLSGNGFAIISDNGPGSQTITVSDGSGVGVRSVSGGGSGQISNFGAGSQTIAVSGGRGVEVQTLAGNGFATIFNGGSGSQTIAVSGATGVDVASAGGFAHISNGGLGNQTISVSGGRGVDVQSNGGGASISQSVPGLAQIITVTDADHINVNGAGGSANIFANGGMQTLSITGSGANAITFGSPGALGFSQMAGGSTQNVIAGLPGGQGSITIVGPAANNTAASIVSRTAAGGTQTIATSGQLSITGGTAPNQTFASGIFHNGSGEQSISAAGIALAGGPSGRGNTAQIGSFGGGVVANAGNQVINVPDGAITLRGSDSGINNRASIFSNGNQTINGNPDLVLMAGASSIAGTTNAGIQTALGRSQTIHAGSITLENAANGGIDSFAGIVSTHQVISATGNVVLTGRGSGGTNGGVRIGGVGGGATDLHLTVGGNLVLTGGAVAGNGAIIGSSGAVPPQPNDLTIGVAGNLQMNAGAGSGVRIGSAATGTAGGNISVTADGNIEMNGTSPDAVAAIRTLGTVRLAADNISQNANGFIVAGTLNTISDGSTSLAGPNRVSRFRDSSATGDIRFNNSSSLLTVSSITAQGISLSQSGALAITGNVVSTGPQTINATGDIRIGADANSVEVRSGGPISMSSGGNLALAGGSSDGSHALLFGSSDINLTVGGFLTINEGSGTDAWARIQTEKGDSAIRIHFPNLASGGYFVNDVEGALRRGHTGLLSGEGVAVPDHTLFVTYGVSD